MSHTDDPKHGANRVNSQVRKKGGNKGIAAAKKAQRREEAERRARTDNR